MRTLVLTLLLVVPLPVSAATYVLENDDVRLEVSPQNGSIIHLVDKRTSTDYISDQARARLFRLLLPQPDYTARHQYEFDSWEIDSADQKVDSVEVEDGTLKVRFHKLQVAPRRYGYMIVRSVEVPPPQLDIDVIATFRLDGPHILANLQVENHCPDEISDVSFPWLGGLTITSGGQRGRAVLPSLAPKSASGLAGIAAYGGGRQNYPAVLATSWMSYEFKDKSIGIEVRTPPETQTASPSLFGGGGGPSLAWGFYPHIAGQNRWTSPDVVIHVHGADWHTMASEHRDWYEQYFSPTRSTAFDRVIGFATYRLKKDDNTVNWTYSELPKLAEQAKLAGIHDLVIEGWREREGPGNPCPFGEIADSHMGGGARLKSLIESLRQQGVELAFAFHPTLVNTAAEQYKKEAFRWTVRSRVQGNQISTSYIMVAQDYPFQDYTAHYWAQIDPASPATDYLLQEAKRLKEEYGFRNLFLRGVGLPSFLSYNQNTAVPPQKTYAVGYARFLGGLKKIFPEGILIMEGFNDLVNGYSSAGYTWSQNEGAEILAFSIPWVPFSNDVEALEYGEANASFARRILINLIVDGGDGTVGRYPEFAQHLKALQSLKEATTPYYAVAEFRDHEGLKKLTADSGVIVSVFNNRASKQVGVVLANLSDQKKKVSLELDLEAKQPKGRLFRLAGRQEEVELAPQVSVELEANEVTMLGIDPKP